MAIEIEVLYGLKELVSLEVSRCSPSNNSIRNETFFVDLSQRRSAGWTWDGELAKVNGHPQQCK